MLDTTETGRPRSGAMRCDSLVGLLFVAVVAGCGDASSSRPSQPSGSSGGASGSGGAGGAGGGAPTGSSGAVGASGGGSAGRSPAAGTGGTTSSGVGGGDASMVVDGGGGGTADGGDASVECVPGSGTTDLDANTARDNKTCLVWQKSSTCMGSWNVVSQCCSNLVQGGFSDWRLPTVSELFTWAKPATNAEYITCPSYVKPGAGDPANNFEYCTVTTYSAVTCAHRGQATTSPTFCVRG